MGEAFSGTRPLKPLVNIWGCDTGVVMKLFDFFWILKAVQQIG